MLMKMEWLYSETKHLAITDSLTGLYNRHYLQENIDREYTRAIRYTTSISVAMIDIDHFKRINDTYGHQFGDYVIREISIIINNCLRKTDLVFRYGGEEIIAIMPETDSDQAFIPLERIRTRIAEKVFENEGFKTHVTISIGIASADKHITTSTQLIELADKALYTAKENGRNQVICT
jgi:diguanylate cyclase (GGDEF)-like protein